MTTETLTYALIEEKIAEYAKNITDEKPGLVERAAFGITAVSWLPLMLATQFAKSKGAVLVVGI